MRVREEARLSVACCRLGLQDLRLLLLQKHVLVQNKVLGLHVRRSRARGVS
jgi:hypothetical protein